MPLIFRTVNYSAGTEINVSKARWLAFPSQQIQDRGLCAALRPLPFSPGGSHAFARIRSRQRFSDTKAASAAPQYPVVIIDAGHGGEDGGASGSNGTLEKDLNLEMAFILRDMLTSNGVSVIMTRTEDVLLYDRSIDYHGRKKQLDLKARLQISDDNPGAVFVSIHMNAFPQKQYSGFQVYYPQGSEESKALADIIQNTVKALLQPDNLRIKTAE